MGPSTFSRMTIKNRNATVIGPLIDFDRPHFFETGSAILNESAFFLNHKSVFIKKKVFRAFRIILRQKIKKKFLICSCPKPGPGSQNLAPPQKII